MGNEPMTARVTPHRRVRMKKYSCAFLCFLGLMVLTLVGSQTSLAHKRGEVVKLEKQQIEQVKRLLEVLPPHWRVLVYAPERDVSAGLDLNLPICVPGTAHYLCPAGGDGPAEVLGAEGAETEQCVCTTTCNGEVNPDGSCSCSTTRDCE